MTKDEIEALLKTLDIWLIVFGVLVAAGVTGEAVIGFIHFRKSGELQRIQAAENRDQQEEIERLKLEIGKADERAAEANRIAEAEHLARIKIEERMAIRNLTPGQHASISSELSGFAGQRADVVVFPVTFETNWTADEIFGLLLNAHWKVPSGVARLSAPPNGLMVQGVCIRATADSQSKAAGRALFEALKSINVGGILHPARLSNPDAPRIWVLVGDKPTPLRTWIK